MIESGGTEVRSYIRIHYTSDTCADYLKGVRAAKTLAALQEHVMTYRRVANDAHEIVQKMDQPAFLAFQKGERSERRGKFAGEDWAAKYGAVILPAVLMQIGLIAQHFGAPWGCAFIRCKEEGMIKEDGGIARWISREAPVT